MKKFLAAAVLIGTFVANSYAQVPKTKISIAGGIDPSMAPLYIGKLGGFFDKNGLDVTINTGPSGSAMVPLLIKNQVQAVLAGEQAGIQSFVLDNDVVVAAEALQARKYFGLVSRNTDTLDGLKGKKIGVAMGSASEVFWRALVDKLNLNPKDYIIVTVEPPEMLAALERGSIDAIAGFEPWVSRINLAVPGAKTLRDNEGILNARSFLYVNRGWAAGNPAVAEAFVRSLLQATDFIRTNPDQAAQQVSTFLKLDLPLTRSLMTKIHFEMRMGADSVDYLKSIDKQLRDAGKLTKPVDFEKFVYADLIKKVASK